MLLRKSPPAGCRWHAATENVAQGKGRRICCPLNQMGSRAASGHPAQVLGRWLRPAQGQKGRDLRHSEDLGPASSTPGIPALGSLRQTADSSPFSPFIPTLPPLTSAFSTGCAVGPHPEQGPAECPATQNSSLRHRSPCRWQRRPGVRGKAGQCIHWFPNGRFLPPTAPVAGSRTTPPNNAPAMRQTGGATDFTLLLRI